MDKLGDIATFIRNQIAGGKIVVAADRYECRECFGSGFREAPDPDKPRDSRYTGVVRCYKCNYWEKVRKKIRDAGHGS